MRLSSETGLLRLVVRDEQALDRERFACRECGVRVIEGSNASAEVISCVAVRSDEPAAARLIAAYFAELETLLGGFDPKRSVSADPDELVAPRGAFLLMRDGERAVACGGIKSHSPGVAEIKRMFTLREARGRGLARDLLLELEREALQLGMTKVVLDTAAPLVAATKLYQSCGYVEVVAFNDNPYAARWFEKKLG